MNVDMLVDEEALSKLSVGDLKDIVDQYSEVATILSKIENEDGFHAFCFKILKDSGEERGGNIDPGLLTCIVSYFVAKINSKEPVEFAMESLFSIVTAVRRSIAEREG